MEKDKSNDDKTEIEYALLATMWNAIIVYTPPTTTVSVNDKTNKGEMW